MDDLVVSINTGHDTFSAITRAQETTTSIHPVIFGGSPRELGWASLLLAREHERVPT